MRLYLSVCMGESYRRVYAALVNKANYSKQNQKHKKGNTKAGGEQFSLPAVSVFSSGMLSAKVRPTQTAYTDKAAAVLYLSLGNILNLAI